MDLKHWRDAASYYDDDPRTKMVSNDDKFRFVALSHGVKDALTVDISTLGERIKAAQEQADPGWWELSESKRREISGAANQLNETVSTPRPKAMR
jgi:hypothetical protein